MRMKVKEIVLLINAVLEDTWTEAEWANGKEIDIPASWRGRLRMILPEYRKAGWEAVRRVEVTSSSPGVPRDYLVFKSPKRFKAQPKEMRSTGIR